MTAHKDRTARIGRESGWDGSAPEVEGPGLLSAEGDADAEGEDGGRVETVNREDVEDIVEADELVGVDAGVEDEGI